ncbi:ABC transporter permease [Thermostichus vulcanus]|uniref:Transport permease protein n=1 Tax=Thermostichus vulcanus str. 'Rupite' TaxID=2813851 RepID=A0ABT0C6A3_THEVL|nr:ABC transporter permease [Thermostichus vulcanus str. 'Rupite']
MKSTVVLPWSYQQIWADSLTVFWRDWLDLRGRVWQVLASGLVAPLIYILAFGVGLGGSLGAGGLASVAGSSGAGSYLRFILPGMVALSAMTISFAGTTFSICGARLFTKSFEELLLLPVHPLSLHLGKVMAGIARGLITALGVLVIGVLGTGAWGLLNPLALLILLLNCAVFAGIGVIAGLKVPSLESVGVLTNFLITPMSFLGATFFDPSQLPSFMQVLVYCLPLSYASVGMRAAAYQPLSQFPWYTVVVLAVLAVILAFVGAYQFSHQQD